MRLPACRYVDLKQLCDTLHARRVELVDEVGFAPLFPGCDLGAEPPIGSLFGMPTIMDDSLMGQEELTFAAGNHEEGVTISVADYVRLASPQIGHFGVRR